jgi:hypothetical protein
MTTPSIQPADLGSLPHMYPKSIGDHVNISYALLNFVYEENDTNMTTIDLNILTCFVFKYCFT